MATKKKQKKNRIHNIYQRQFNYKLKIIGIQNVLA